MTGEEIANKLLQTGVFTNYPFLVESRVVSLSDELFKYTAKRIKGQLKIEKIPHNEEGIRWFENSCEKVEAFYSKKRGVGIGAVTMLAKVEQCVGMQLLNDGSFVKKYETLTSYDLPVQLLITGNYHDSRFQVIFIKLECTLPSSE